MKPFNLKEALAGAPVVSRRGVEVTQLHLFEIDHLYPLYAIIEGEVIQCTIKGEFRQFYETGWDLFMKEEEKAQWVNVWETKNGYILTTNHNREDQADLEIENELIHKHLKKIRITL
jgi:hypothetical protein